MGATPDLHGQREHTDAESGADLKYALDMLQMLMDSLDTAVFWKDLDSRFIGCNRALAELAGKEPEDLVDHTDHDMPWFAEADDYIAWDRRVIESGEPRLGIIESLTDERGAKRWLETNKSPIRNLDGEIVGILGSFRDITAETEAKRELQDTLDDLDSRVRAATIELARSNASLRREVSDRVRAEEEQRHLREGAEQISETMTQMSHTLDLCEALDALVDGVHRSLSADLVGVVLRSDAGDLRLAAATSHSDITNPDLLERDLPELSALTRPGKPLNDPEITLGQARCTMAVELRTGGTLLGFVVTESNIRDLYNDRHIERLTLIAGLAAPVVANILRTQMASELAVESELDRVSREVHDTLGQTLWAAEIGSHAALDHLASDHPARPLLEQSIVALGHATAQVQDLLVQLREPSGPSSLVDLLQSFVWSAPIAVRSNVVAESRLDPRHRPAVCLIAREALRNIDRHANATKVDITLTEQGSGEMQLHIVDNGTGFDHDPALTQSLEERRTGLRSMRQRAAALGGTLTIEGRPGHGTTVTLLLPDLVS